MMHRDDRFHDVGKRGARLNLEPLVTGANAVQHGGDHYKKMAYEHWDFVVDARLGYLLGNATKYASRWRNKNGREDLKKCGHYIEKAMERGERPPTVHHSLEALFRFVRNLDPKDAVLVGRIVLGDWDGALACVGELISECGTGTPTPAQQG